MTGKGDRSAGSALAKDAQPWVWLQPRKPGVVAQTHDPRTVDAKIRSSSSGKTTLKVEHLLPNHEDHRNPPRYQLGVAAHFYLQPQKADTEPAGQRD